MPRCGREPEAARPADVLYGIGELCRLIDRAEWRTLDEGPVRTTRFEITFADTVQPIR